MGDFFYRLRRFEYWPTAAQYFPVLIGWPYLSFKGKDLLFFTAVNPFIYGGGSFGESKSEILKLLPQKYVPTTTVFDPQKDSSSQFTFPVVAKPDIGERGSHVTVVHSAEELAAYAKNVGRQFLLQEYLSSNFEAGVMVIRDPASGDFRITSIAVKEFLTITGDGVKTLQELIIELPRARFQWDRLKSKFEGKKILKAGESLLLEPIGNHCRGTIFKNGNHLVTPELTKVMRELAGSIKDFHFGRFDLKAHSEEEFQRGETIKIMELNGAFSEPGHIYDPEASIFHSWKDLLIHWNQLAGIAGQNIKRGHRPLTLKELWTLYRNHCQLGLV